MGRKRLPGEVQAMVDGGTNLLNIIITLVAAIRALAVKLKKTDAEWSAALHRLSQPEGKETLVRIAEVVLGVVTITAVARQSFADLLQACQQKWFNSDFTEVRWPLEPVATDEHEWEVAEYFFGDDANGDEKVRRLVELEKTGTIRMLGGVRRAMEFVAAHPDLQKHHHLVVPVSARDSVGNVCLPVFCWSMDYGLEGREFCLCIAGNGFSSSYGWLVLRKRHKA